MKFSLLVSLLLLWILKFRDLMIPQIMQFVERRAVTFLSAQTFDFV